MTAKGFDIAVIGGGVIGLTLARALLNEGARVAVIDAGSAIPAATNAAAGMLAPSFEHGEDAGPVSEALYRLGARGLALWPAFAEALEEETGVFIDFRGHGALGLAFDANEAEALAAQAARVSALGGNARMISGDEARTLEPALSRGVVAALHAPADAQVDPRRLAAALGASLAKKMAPHFAARVVLLEKNRRGHGLVTAAGERIEAETVVVASGAVSGLVARDLVFPVKGEAVAVANSALTRVVRAPGAYLCPKAEGRLVIGASETRGRDDHSVDDAAIEALKRGAARAVPALEGATETERWAGLRPGTPDGAPILGQDEDGRFLALGHYRNGVLHAPAAAAAMAALILGRAPALDLAPFSAGRFRAGHNA